MFAAIGKNLSRKVLIILAVAIVLPLLALTFLSAFYQARDMINEMTLFGDELAHAIYGGIKYPMSKGDSVAVRNQLLDMQEKMRGIEIFICRFDQDVVYATCEDMIGEKVDNSIYNQKFWRQLLVKPETGGERKVTFEEKIGQTTYLTSVRLISNQEECHRCHGKTRDVLGSMVVKMATDRTYTNIHNHTGHIIFISIAVMAVIMAFAYAMLHHHVTLPVKQLAKKMKNLPDRIAAGEYPETIDNNNDDEIGNLEKVFHQMAMDLQEKREIIDRANKDLTAANKELEAFAYSVSHDLRAPLRNIDGFSKILLDDYHDQLDGTGRHYLDRIRKGTARMSRLIDDMLNFSRAGRAEIQMRMVDFNFLIKEILKDFAGDIKQRNIIIDINKLPVILCDSAMIKNVFTNLLSNSIKYTGEKKQAKITVGFDKDKKALFVKDNGIGFDRKYHEQIFHTFQRLHLPEEYEGTGIGLAIAKRIVERHHGSLWAESEPGKGATFFVRLPSD